MSNEVGKRLTISGNRVSSSTLVTATPEPSKADAVPPVETIVNLHTIMKLIIVFRKKYVFICLKPIRILKGYGAIFQPRENLRA